MPEALKTSCAASEPVWEPEEHLVELMCRTIEAVCILWPKKKNQQEALQVLGQEKMATIWQAQRKRLVLNHETVCAKVFWDHALWRYPSNGVHGVLAVWNGSASTVTLTVDPSSVVTHIQFVLDAK